MEEMLKDERFAHVARDPKFRRIPKSERKVVIDKRFQSMFKDKKFTVKYTVDKRGRPVNQSSKENLKKYYDLPSDEEDDEENDKQSEGKKQKKDRKIKKTEKDKLNVSERKKDKQKKETKSLSKKKVAEKEVIKKNKTKDEKKKSTNGSLIKVKSTKNKAKEEEEELSEENEESSSETEGIKEESFEDEEEDFNESEDEESEVEEEEDSDNEEDNVKEIKDSKKSLQIRKKDEPKELSKDMKKKLRNLRVDYARGEGVLFSDSSSSEEEDSEDEESDEEGLVHDWGEFDKEAETTDTITNRLAVCNMDWDRIRAVDLMVLFSSFLPKGRIINSVTIYPSEFGLQRMKEEEIKGPKELVESKDEDENNDNEEDGEEGSSYHREKMRQYQLNRMKYYYAIVDFDSADSADTVYTECDGVEFELTGAKLDLRFVPDDTTFDQEPKEVCNKLPNLTKYKPRQFVTTALQQVKVDLTWDETDPNRIEIFGKLNAGKFDEVTESDLRNYLASGSSEDESENEAPNGTEESENKQKKMSTIEKYKALLKSIDEEEAEKKRNKEMELEVSWDMNAKEKAEQLVKDSMKNSEELTPFEKYLEKRKEKKKAKREEKKKIKSEEANSDSEDDIPSDVDMNDPYFAEEIQSMKKSAKKRKIVNDEEEQDSEEERRKAELELLLMDKDEDNKKHFNIKKIEEIESMTKSKKKRLEKKKKKVEVTNEFEVDVKDPRFAAIYTSHHYNIDPSDSHYRKTKGTEALIQEKLKKRNLKDDNDNENDNDDKSQDESQLNSKVGTSNLKSTELSALVKSVKRKASGLKRK